MIEFLEFLVGFAKLAGIGIGIYFVFRLAGYGFIEGIKEALKEFGGFNSVSDTNINFAPGFFKSVASDIKEVLETNKKK